MRRLVPWLAAIALFAVAACAIQFGVPGARTSAAPPAPVRVPAPPDSGDRSRAWADLAPRAYRWRNGTEFVLLVREARGGTVHALRERWVLLRRDSLGGDFEIRRPGSATIVRWAPFHPALDAAGAGRELAALHAVGGGRVAVKVPAGRFRCRRTWHRVAGTGASARRVEEWWSPGVPVPVERWSQPAAAESAAAPPRRARDLRPGGEWAVLERVRRP